MPEKTVGDGAHGDYLQACLGNWHRTHVQIKGGQGGPRLFVKRAGGSVRPGNGGQT